MVIMKLVISFFSSFSFPFSEMEVKGFGFLWADDKWLHS